MAHERGESFQIFFTMTAASNGVQNPHVLCALEAAERVAKAAGTKVRRPSSLHRIHDNDDADNDNNDDDDDYDDLENDDDDDYHYYVVVVAAAVSTM